MSPAHTMRVVVLSFAAGCAWPSPTAVPAPLAAPGPAPALAFAISEIQQELTSGWAGPVYTVVLRREGTAEYRGECCVPMLGFYRAHIDSATFISLAAYLMRHNFGALQGIYKDLSLEEDHFLRTMTTVVMGDDTIVIDHYEGYGPPVLRQIEGSINEVVYALHWNKSR